jgi:hypothetical protein
MAPWALILKTASFIEAVVAAVVAVPLVDVLAGQPFPIAPNVRHAVMTYLPLWIAGLVVLSVVVLVAWDQEHKTHGDHPRQQTATTGPRASQSPAIAGDGASVNYQRTATVEGGAVQSPAIVGDNSPVIYNNDGVLNQIFTARNNPEEIIPTLRAIDSVLNAGDPAWIRRVSSDGSYTLSSRSPEAAARCPMRVETTVQLPDGETMLDVLRRAAETLEPVTINEAHVKGLRVFLGDKLIQDVTTPGAITITSAPLAPPVNCVLRVPETGAELANLELGLYLLPNGRIRLSNKQHASAPIVVSIDFAAPTQLDAADDEFVDTGGCTMTIETRPLPGRKVRHMVALYGVLLSLRTARQIHIYDYAAAELRFIAHGALPNVLHPDEEAFADALILIQNTYPTATLPFETPSRQELETVLEVAHIIRTGELVNTIEALTITFAAWGVNGFLQHCDGDGILRGLRRFEEGGGVVLFGAALDLGPSWLDMCPLKLVRSREALQADAATLTPDDSVIVEMVPADPADHRIVRHYTRFTSEKEQAS